MTFHAHAAKRPSAWQERAVAAIATEIELLPLPQQLVVALVHHEGLAFGEVASALDMSARDAIELHRLATLRLVNALRCAGIDMSLPSISERSARAQ